MVLEIDGHKIPEDKQLRVIYGHDHILNGVMLDMPDTYVFLSEHDEGHREMIEEIEQGDIEWFDMSDQDIDFSDIPHCWVVKSVERAIVKTAEQLLDK